VGNADRFLDSVATACSGRVIFGTEMGYGWHWPRGPPRPEIRSVSLYGVDIPFILRREGESGVLVMGACYVRPLMRGEAVQETVQI